MVMSRYEFLAELHAILRPSTYLEVGVQTGASLVLAERSDVAVGIDPDLTHFRAQNRRPNQRLVDSTSADYFACLSCERPRPDFSFIDGSHLFEDALRDFIAIERLGHVDSVIAFDDVLPYNQAIAERIQPPGDWTGDVWKIYYLLDRYRVERDSLTLTLINVSPTGLLLVTGLDPDSGVLSRMWRGIGAANTHRSPVDEEFRGDTVPDEIIQRTHAWDAQSYLTKIRETMKESTA